MSDQWYVPLIVAGAVVIALLVAGVAALEVFAGRAARDAPVPGWAAPRTTLDGALTRKDMAVTPPARSTPPLPALPSNGG